MKLIITLTSFAAFLGLGLAAAAAPAVKVPKLRPTHEQLTKEQGAARQSSHTAVRILQVEPGSVVQKRSDQTSLVSRSTVINFGDYWTLVPKGAVLHVPAALKGRLGGEPKGRLLSWSDFYNRNRGWLRQQPVTVSHARGDEVLPEESLKHISTLSQIVVATCHNGPISMKKPAAEVSK